MFTVSSLNLARKKRREKKIGMEKSAHEKICLQGGFLRGECFKVESSLPKLE